MDLVYLQGRPEQRSPALLRTCPGTAGFLPTQLTYLPVLLADPQPWQDAAESSWLWRASSWGSWARPLQNPDLGPGLGPAHRILAGSTQTTALLTTTTTNMARDSTIQHRKKETDTRTDLVACLTNHQPQIMRMERHLHLLLLLQRQPPHLAAPGPQKRRQPWRWTTVLTIQTGARA